MTEADLLKAAEVLHRGAADLARAASGIDPAVVDSHMGAVAEARRVLCVEIAVSGSRLYLSASTVPVNGSNEAERFSLFTLRQRQDRAP